MARSISTGLSGVLEELELARPELVTLEDIALYAQRAGVSALPRVVASRLKERGWLLATPQRGVWEFAPAEAAGAYSSFDPLLPIKSFALANPAVEWALTFQAAAWALGLADRVSSTVEVAFAERPRLKLPQGVLGVTYRSNLPLEAAKGARALAPEGIVVGMAQSPLSVRSWSGAAEWLPDVMYEVSGEALLKELEGRPASVWARTGYLVQGFRPDAAKAIGDAFSPKSKIRFGGRGKAVRNDERWLVSDTVLPFDPREAEAVR